MRPTTALSVLVLVGLVVAARGAGNLYPLSTFPMYAGSAGGATSHVMVRSGDELLEVTAFRSFECPPFARLDTLQCGDAPGIPYVDRERDEYLRAHAAPGGEPVELVRRLFSFDGRERPKTCALVSCRAVRE